MILTKKIKIKTSKQNFKLYKSKGYIFNIGDTIEIDVNDLSKSNNRIIDVKCDICGKEKKLRYVKYLQNINNGGYYSCSGKCAVNKNKQTCLKNIGVEYPGQSIEVKNKMKETCLEKYGCENPQQNNEIREKTKETIKEKYGCEYTFQSEKIREKGKISCLEKFGVENSSQSDIIKNKKNETCLEHYGVEHALQSNEIKEKFLNTLKNNYIEKYKGILNIIDKNKESLKIKCNKCDEIYDIKINQLNGRISCKTILCTHCNPIDSLISGREIQLLEFIIENYNNEMILNNRNIISPYELDIYLPELKLAFEFNGLYWHSNINKPYNYHKMKSDLCEEKDIQLIHIWEDDWLYKTDIIKSIILDKLNIYKEYIDINDCKIKEINDNELVEKFLNDNNINSYIESEINIGLFYNKELISLLTINNNEIVRFCNKINTYVDSFSKLFNHFIKKYKSKEIVISIDRSYSNGKLYEQLGFKFIEKTEPECYYVINDNRYDINKSEKEYPKIFDSGKLKFIF